jgi:hypothetical protein
MPPLMADKIDGVPGAQKAIKRFLEESGLYSPLTVDFKVAIDLAQMQAILPSTLARSCDNCPAEATTTWVQDQKSNRDMLAYGCAACGKSVVQFVLAWDSTRGSRSTAHGPVSTVERFSLTKVGQVPQWSGRVSKRMQKVLGAEALGWYRKGCACLAEGLGIGASAYFRRIVEAKTDALLDLVERTARADEDETALSDLAQARAAFSAAERLGLAANHLPPSLRPGGVNPLKIFYSSLSGPLHNQSEEAACASARAMLDSFSFVFEKLEDSLAAAEQYRQQMQAVLAQKDS